MNEIELKKLHDKIQSVKDFGDFNKFKSKMGDVNPRKRFYDKYFSFLKSKGINLGSYDEYERRLSSGNTNAGGSTGGGGNSSSNENTESGSIYTTNGDPYQYKVVGCVWYTKSLENRGKIIKDWKSLEGNNNATKILDGRFPNARKECKENKPKNSNIVVGGQPQVQVGSTTPTGGQSGVNQSQGLGVPNVSELGLDEIDKLVNPVKPETVTQTPTTQKESIKDNVNILKEEFYSTLKKIS
jgi:hypothetical protein